MVEDDLIPRPAPKPCKIMENLAKPEVPEVSLVFDGSRSISAFNIDKLNYDNSNKSPKPTQEVRMDYASNDNVRQNYQLQLSCNKNDLGTGIDNSNAKDMESKADKKRVSFSSMSKQPSADSIKRYNVYNLDYLEPSDIFSPTSSCCNNEKCNGTPTRIIKTKCCAMCNDNQINTPNVQNFNNEKEAELMSNGNKIQRSIYNSCCGCNNRLKNRQLSNFNENCLRNFYSSADEQYIPSSQSNCVRAIFEKLNNMEMRLNQMEIQIKNSLLHENTVTANHEKFIQQFKMHQQFYNSKYSQLKSELEPLFEVYDKIERMEYKIRILMSDKVERCPVFGKCTHLVDDGECEKFKSCGENNGEQVHCGNNFDDNYTCNRRFENSGLIDNEIIRRNTGKVNCCCIKTRSHDSSPLPTNTHVKQKSAARFSVRSGNFDHSTSDQCKNLMCELEDKSNTQSDHHTDNYYYVGDTNKSDNPNGGCDSATVCNTSNTFTEYCQNQVARSNNPITERQIQSKNCDNFKLQAELRPVEKQQLQKQNQNENSDVCEKIIQNVKNIIKSHDGIISKNNNDTTQIIKNITYEYLSKLNLHSATLNEDNPSTARNGSNRNEELRPEYGLPRQNTDSNKIGQPLNSPELDSSLQINSLAMKYISDGSRDRDIKKSSVSSNVEISAASATTETNISYATLHYLQRYQLLPTGDPMKNFNMQCAASSVPNQFVAAQSSNILDITAIKQQPKFL